MPPLTAVAKQDGIKRLYWGIRNSVNLPTFTGDRICIDLSNPFDGKRCFISLLMHRRRA